ncbi:unnamed protein product [Dracunculus medinensis]|uniref:procollagen-lysine 5-dioxygenase n=1 Tax=Dracunculus medinensis TaxID=318479 RepID=A0A3P7PP80_DRAME|nr:unnamed protein product [Dracunculus medinensis]
MGYANDIWRMLNSKIDNADMSDLQNFYNSIYTDNYFRDILKIGLDSTTRIFQIIDRNDGVTVEFDDNGYAYVHDTLYNTYPLIINAAENSIAQLNNLGNYIGKFWSNIDGCISCNILGDGRLKANDKDNWPVVTLGIFIAKPVPFVDEFLISVISLTYPKSKIILYVYNNQIYNKEHVKIFRVEQFSKRVKYEYRSVDVDNIETDIGEREARRTAIKLALQSGSDFAFLIDADIHFMDQSILQSLIKISDHRKLYVLLALKGIIAPMAEMPERLFSNFWGALGDNGYYTRSDDYIELVYRKRIGVWNVPYIASAILINKEKLQMHALLDAYDYNIGVDPDISFCQFARENGHFLFVDNRKYYGFLVDSDEFDSEKRLHPEMYQIFKNRYVNAFAQELIEEMEHYGKWSSGSNKDDRIAGGYENVPTIDIHMKQIDFERQWLFFLDEYPVYANMMFVVRYKPGEQPSLRPHHDASTYTIDISLNKRGRDYEGGGIFYVRYNCTVAADRVGYAAMFPGRLTHLHEGLPTTRGIRYISVSFLNP